MKRQLNFAMRGLVTDLPPESVPEGYWSDGENVYEKDLSIRRVGGYGTYAVTGFLGGNPIFILPVETATDAYWIYVHVAGGVVSVGLTNGGTHWDITPTPAITASSGTAIGTWTGTVLNGVPVVNNQVDEPWYWDGNTGNPLTQLPGWPANQFCRSIRSYRNHLFALGVTDGGVVYPDRIDWSDSAASGTIPTSWTAGPTTDAGDNDLGDTEGGVIDGAKLRDSFVIYKNYSTTLCTFVGGNFIFSFRDSPSISTGAQSQNCIAESQGFHYVFTGDDVIRHDGQTAVSICTDTIRNELVSSIDPDVFEQVLVTARHLTDEVWICIPEIGSITGYLTAAFVYNTKTERWGKRKLPGVTHIDFGIVGDETAVTTWNPDTEAWNDDVTQWNAASYSESAAEILMTDHANTRLLVVDRLETDAGTEVMAYVQRIGLPIEPMQRIKYVNECWPNIIGEAGQEFQVSIGGQLNYQDPVNWYPPVTFTLGDQPAKIDCWVAGRYISVQFKTTSGKVWRIYGFRLTISDKGRY